MRKYFAFILLSISLCISSIAQPPEIAITGDVLGTPFSIPYNSLPTSVSNNTDFGNVPISSSLPLNFNIENIGSTSLNVTNITLAFGSYFSLSHATLPLVPINGGASDWLIVSFNAYMAFPTTGTYVDTVYLYSDDPTYPIFKFTISGNAVPDPTGPEIDIEGGGFPISDGSTTTSLSNNTDFGNVAIGSPITKTFYIINNSADPLTIANPNFSGPGLGDYTIAASPSLFIAPFDFTSFDVQFNPSTTGARDMTISITNDDLDENPYTFDVTGFGTTGGGPEINVTGNGLTILTGSSSPQTNNNTDFGPVDVGSGLNKFFVAENSGSTPLTIFNLFISGPNASDFNIVVPLPPTITAGNGSNFQLSFTPSSPGLKTATIFIASDDADEGSYSFVIQGLATTPAPEFDLTSNGNLIPNNSSTFAAANNTYFGQVTIDNPLENTYIIENNGTLPLSVGTPTLTGPNAADFTITTFPATTVAPGSTTSFSIQALSSFVGTSFATCDIPNDDSDENPYTFDLKADFVTLPSPNLVYVGRIVTYSPDPFPLLAFSNSDGDINYSIVSGTAATIDPITGMVTPLSEGTVIIRASQNSTSVFASASSNATLVILKAQPYISLIPRGEIAGSPDFNLDILTDFDGTFTYSMIGDNAVATIQPNGTITPISPGEIEVVVIGTGSSKFNDCIAQATVTIYATVQKPIAVNDTLEIELGTTLTYNILENDSSKTGGIVAANTDIDFEIEGIQKKYFQPTIGNFTIDEEGILTFTPFETFIGSTTIGYFITDDDGVQSDMGLIIISVKLSNPDLAPELKANDVISANEDGKNDALVIGFADQSKPNTLTILDESNNVIFTTENYKNDWTGLDKNNKKVNSGVYFYVFNENDGQRVLNGFVQVIR